MRSLVTLLSAVAIAASTAQFATAGEHHARKPARAAKTTSEQFRNANAAWAAPTAAPDVYRYSGGFSAPAGH
jgi:hypothetical protein